MNVRKDQLEANAASGASENAPKKAYTSPVLTVFGDFRRLTQNVGSHGNPDGGFGAGMMSSQP